MRFYPFMMRFALLVMLALGYSSRVSAQEPELPVEELALRTHTQNIRAHSYTAWIGGVMGDPAQAPPVTAVGETLDRWMLDGLAGDVDLLLADLTRPVLLNFWASWCPPCQLEFPHLVSVALAPDQHDFDVVFVNVWDERAAAVAYLSDYPSDIHTVLDAGDRLAGQASIFSIPTSLLIDTDGTVLVAHVGIVTPTVTAFLDAVAAHPGEGVFVAGDHEVTPQAVLLPVEAETATLIAIGESVTGTLTETDFQHAYRFEGSANQSIEISLEAPDNSALDPYVVLMTADEERIAENDDISPGVIQDSSLIVPLPEDGVYLVVATRFLEAEGFTTGDYRLTLRAVPEEVPPDGLLAPGEGGTFTYGETVTGRLSDDHYEDRWLFEGQQGDVITLRMARTVDEMGGLDGYLILKGPDGVTLIEVDDASTSVMPSLDAYQLPADGRYTVVATRFGFENGFSAGEYTLSLDQQSVASTPTEPPTGESGVISWLPAGTLPPGLHWITYNDPMPGTIGRDHVDNWLIFRGRADDVITIRMTGTSGDLDPFLILTDANGIELARSDDSGDSKDAEITSFTLPTTDTYLIRATRYGFENGPSSGDYMLVIETDAEPVEPETLEPIGILRYREPMPGSLHLDKSRDRYTFAVQSGIWTTIALRRVSGDLDASLVLLDAEGTKIAAGKPWGENAGRIIQVRLPAGGEYSIDVMLEDLTTSGDYELILLPAPSREVNPGAFVPAEGLDLELVLIWDAYADLDLDGSALPGGDTTARANDFCAAVSGMPVERIVWVEGTTQPGYYPVTITYNLNCGGENAPVAFILAVAVRGEVVDLVGGSLAREGDMYTTWIEVGR